MKKAIFMYFLGTFVNFFSLWVMTVFCVRLLNYEAAGILSLGMSIAGVFTVISNYGIRSFQVSDIEYKYSDWVYVSARIITILIGVLFCLIFSFVMGYDSGQIWGINLFMLFKTTESFYDVLHGSLQRYHQTYYVGTSLIIKGIVNILVFSCGLIITQNLNVTLLASTLANCILIYVIDWHKLKQFSQFKIKSGQALRIIQLLKECLLMLFFGLASPLLVAIPRIVLESVHGTDLLGIYSSIASPTVIISTFAQCILLPFIGETAMTYSNKNIKKLCKLIFLPFIIINIIGILCLLAGDLFGSFALTLLYGNGILPYSGLLRFVIISAVLTSLIMCFNNFIIAVRKLRQLLVISFTGCLLTFVLSFPLIETYNIYGVAYVMIISQAIQLLLLLLYTIKLIINTKNMK